MESIVSWFFDSRFSRHSPLFECPIHRQLELGADAGIGLAGVRPSHRVRGILHRPVRRQQECFADGGTTLRLISDCHS